MGARRTMMPFRPRQLMEKFTSPWRTLEQMEDEMQRWIEKNSLLNLESIEGVDFVPHCNLKETKNEFIAKFDLPGVKKQDLKIEIDGRRVTVRGERKSDKEEKDEKRYHAESYHGSFLRTFTLPTDVDEQKINAHYEDGVLTVKIPKSEAAAKAKEVTIN